MEKRLHIPFVALGLYLFFGVANAQVSPVFTQKFNSVYPPHSYVNQTLYFSRYDAGGNDKDLLAVGSSGEVRPPESTEKNLLLIAQNKQWSVYRSTLERDTYGNSLFVKKSGSSAPERRIKLLDVVLWAGINDSGKLLVVQQSNMGFGNESYGLIFQLPSLRLLTKVSLVRNLSRFRNHSIEPWGSHIVAAGESVALYDKDLKLEAELITTPPECGAYGPVAIGGNRAVIGDCGKLLIVDLESRTLERSVPPFTKSLSIGIADGLIVSAPVLQYEYDSQSMEYVGTTPLLARVYDLYTGYELKQLPLAADDIYSSGDKLIAVSGYGALTVQIFDGASLRAAK